jgi:triosephosphate isomerase
VHDYKAQFKKNMNIKKRIFVANWKMNMPFYKAQAFIKTHLSALKIMAQKQNTTIIVCPSFISLADACAQTRLTAIKIGAQTCSQHSQGAYTGEVDAISIAQAGCTYVIIGHSERRNHYYENNEIVGQKVARLLENNLIPIICIGETLNDYINGLTFEVLQQQLEPLFVHAQQAQDLIIAYEPVWSIGTGVTPDTNYLEKVFTWLANNTAKIAPKAAINLLYGGSVDENNASKIIRIFHINGFLIGNASLNFQKFQNIVSSGDDTVTTTK